MRDIKTTQPWSGPRDLGLSNDQDQGQATSTTAVLTVTGVRQRQQQHVCCCAGCGPTTQYYWCQDTSTTATITITPYDGVLHSDNGSGHLPPTHSCWALCIDVMLTVAQLPFTCLAASLTEKRESTRLAARLIFMVVLLVSVVSGWCLHVNQSLVLTEGSHCPPLPATQQRC